MADSLICEEMERVYWSGKMEEAYAFMMRVQQFRLSDCGEVMVDLREAVADAGVEVWFSDAPFAQTMKRLFYLRCGLIQKFLAAASEMNQRGWVMKVEDAYRTPEMQKALQRSPALFDSLLKTVLWETKGDVLDAEFVFRRLLAMIAFCPVVGTHIGGSALDISVYQLETGEEVDRGAPYLTFNIKTPMASPYISDQARKNRRDISILMKRHGFVDYPWEFWHYNQQDAYHAVLVNDDGIARYGPVHWEPFADDISPIVNLAEPLNSMSEISGAIEESLCRLNV